MRNTRIRLHEFLIIINVLKNILSYRAVAILRQASASNHVEMAVARDDQSKYVCQ